MAFIHHNLRQFYDAEITESRQPFLVLGHTRGVKGGTELSDTDEINVLHGDTLKFYVRADFVAALCLDQYIPPRLDARCQQHIVNSGQCQLRSVVCLAQMAQSKLFAAVLNQVQQFRRAGTVIQMPPVTGNADLEIIGIGPALQAEPVVVGLQRHQVTPGKMLLHHRSQNPQVGGNGHGAFIRRADAIAAAGHVVAGGKGSHHKGADLLGAAVDGDGLDGGGQGSPGFQHFQRCCAAVDGNRIMLQKSIQAADMVGVLMGDEDALTVGNGKPQLAQRREGGAAAFAHIHKKIFASVADQRAVSG